jgi:hypothetical protein
VAFLEAFFYQNSIQQIGYLIHAIVGCHPSSAGVLWDKVFPLLERESIDFLSDVA